MKSEIGKIINEAMDRRDAEIAALRSQLAERDALVGELMEVIKYVSGYRVSWIGTHSVYQSQMDCKQIDALLAKAGGGR